METGAASPVAKDVQESGEARLQQSSLLKNVLTAIEKLITEGNIECDEDGLSFQGMDSSHVSLVDLLLKKRRFTNYCCGTHASLGCTMSSLMKILKCAQNTDSCTLKWQSGSDDMSLQFESADLRRLSNFTLKLMEIDTEKLAIPDTDYPCIVKMPSEEFQRVCLEMAIFGDTVCVEVNKSGINFSLEGAEATVRVFLPNCEQTVPKKRKRHDSAPHEATVRVFLPNCEQPVPKKRKRHDSAPHDDDDDDDDDNSGKKRTKRYTSENKDNVNNEEDAKIAREFNLDLSEEEPLLADNKPIKKKKQHKKHNRGDDDNDSEQVDEVSIRLQQEEPVKMNFANRYLCFFAKATSLSDFVYLKMKPDHPIQIEYMIGDDDGHLRFYLAPKTEEASSSAAPV